MILEDKAEDFRARLPPPSAFSPDPMVVAHVSQWGTICGRFVYHPINEWGFCVVAFPRVWTRGWDANIYDRSKLPRLT